MTVFDLNEEFLAIQRDNSEIWYCNVSTYRVEVASIFLLYGLTVSECSSKLRKHSFHTRSVHKDVFSRGT